MFIKLCTNVLCIVIKLVVKVLIKYLIINKYNFFNYFLIEVLHFLIINKNGKYVKLLFIQKIVINKIEKYIKKPVRPPPSTQKSPPSKIPPRSKIFL